MSHFTTIKTRITDADALRSALLFIGKPQGAAKFSEEYVLVDSEGLTLFGYQGDDRSKLPEDNPNFAPPCEVVVRQQTIGGASNDIGFSRQSDGTLAAHISDYDRHCFDERWLNRLSQRYSVIKAERQIAANPDFAGWDVQELSQDDGTVQLRLRQQRRAASPVAARL